MVTFWILIALVLLGIVGLISIYNILVNVRENVKNGWSQIDVQLKRRHDLIANLVETAKAYMSHEKETLERVIKARQHAIDASNVQDKQMAENLLTGTLRSLFAVAESYPNLKADQQMVRLQEELTSTENKIAFARQYYNDEVNRLNVAIQSFPNNVIAQMFGFSKSEFFQIENPQEKEVPNVKF